MQTFTAARKIATLIDTMCGDELDDFANSLCEKFRETGMGFDKQAVVDALLQLGRDERQRGR